MTKPIDLAEVRRRFLLVSEDVARDVFVEALQAAKCPCAACGRPDPLDMQGTMRMPSGRVYAYGVCGACYEHVDVGTVVADVLGAFDGKQGAATTTPGSGARPN